LGFYLKKEWKMKKLLGLAGLTVCLSIVTAFFASCPQMQDEEKEFTKAPVLTLVSGDGSLTYSWRPSEPAADSYDVYYLKGRYDAEMVKAGNIITNAASGGKKSGLENGSFYSVVVTANKEGYKSVDSGLGQQKPGVVTNPGGGGDGTNKRGVSYNFTTGNTSAADMALLAPGISWFYDWGTSPNSAAQSAANANNVAYVPMAWNAQSAVLTNLRAYISAHPEIEYLLAYNEPNLTDQANMTPAQAAQQWPNLVAFANEFDLKLVSPAMNYGTLSGYGDPIKWLDEFFAKPGVSINDISAIAIHCYMQYPSAVRSYINLFKKYNKPLWMTEFCAWENISTVTWQREYMSQVVTYMELDPAVERYAWFIPKGGGDITVKPYNKLLTAANPPELTELGTVYTQMSHCDQSVWVPVNQRIEAEHFTDCNLSDLVNGSGTWKDTVRFRPTADTEGGLDIYDFKDCMQVVYQLRLTETRAYTLTLRNTAAAATNIDIYVDGSYSSSISLTQSSAWRTSTFSVQLPSGDHAVALEVSNTNGNCALNWLKVE
jgi:hypothetical protein